MCHNLPCYSTVIVSRLWLVTQNLWSRGLATRNNNRTRNPIVNCNVSGCTSWNRVMVSSHSDGGRKGTYARLKYIRENICYGRDEKWILFLKAMGRFFFLCVEYCTSVELKCIKCGTLKKKTRYSEWNATEFKFPMRKHRLKIAERF